MPKRAAGTETGPGLNADAMAAGETTWLLEEGDEGGGTSSSGVFGITRTASEAEATVDELLYETVEVPCQRYITPKN